MLLFSEREHLTMKYDECVRVNNIFLTKVQYFHINTFKKIQLNTYNTSMFHHHLNALAYPPWAYLFILNNLELNVCAALPARTFFLIINHYN